MNSSIELLHPARRLLPHGWQRRLNRYRYNLATATAMRVMVFGLGLGMFISLMIFYAAQRAELARWQENIAGLVSTIESTASIACFAQDPTLAGEVAKGLLANRAVASVHILAGSLVLADVHKQSGQTQGIELRRKMFSPFNAADEVGEVVLVADDAYIQAEARRVSWLFVFVSLIEMALIALVVAWVVLRTIVRPIREFSDTLRTLDVESGEFAAYPANNQYNEVGQLADSFNNLLAHLFQQVKNEQGLSAQLALKESQFRALAENSPNSIVRYDTTCRRIYCNPAYDHAVGIRSGEAINTTPVEMWRAVNLSGGEYQRLLQTVMSSAESANVLLEWKKSDGHLVSNDFFLVPERDADGHVCSVLALGHDISELKKQQQRDADRARVFESMVRVSKLPEVLTRVAGHVKNSFGAFQCAILLLDESDGCLRIGAAPGLPQAYALALESVDTPFPVFDDRYRYWTDFELAAEAHDLAVRLYEPITDSHQNLVGVLVLYQGQSDPQQEIDINFMHQACSLAALAIERDRFERLVQHQASYDALTDLPNRRLFMQKLREEIARARRTSGKVSLLFIDLDRFKNVNDTLGHEMGDLLLVQVAARIRHCLREYDTVARLGGDEFTVIIADTAEATVLGGVARAIVETLAQPFVLAGNSAYISASIGIAAFPADATHPEQLVRSADQAMYAAKQAGRNNFHFYSEALALYASERLALEQDLRTGLGRGELELFFQPKLNLKDGALVGSEALVRWNHPERGLIQPDKFIAIAEDSGLIVELGERVLRAACRTAREWNGDGKPRHKIAINLSALQFKSGKLHQTVRAILSETGCAPDWIELEITESLLLEESDNVLDILHGLRGMGITIAIDDFGTGYSALGYLARFPIDILKIDQSFTAQIADNGYHAEVVRAIISIAQALNQQVVAEGVNTQEQATMLRDCGCHVAQGFLYGKPVARAEFEAVWMMLEAEMG